VRDTDQCKAEGAETDATKRALATFGNPFGLALYDCEWLVVRKVRSEKALPPMGTSASGMDEASFDKPSEFGDALRNSMTEAHDIELLFAIWEQNVETVRVPNRSLKQEALPKSGTAPQLVNQLKQCAIGLVKPRKLADGSDRMANLPAPKSAPPKIDKRVLTISEPKRIRCKEHLRFVAAQPCLICGRSPSHAHHVRYAQSRGLTLRSAMNSPSHFAPSTTTRSTPPARNESGGNDEISTRTKLLVASGNRAASATPPRAKLI
jgi:Rad52/22 family double-strand break repair protein